MKTIGASQQAHIAGPTTTLASCWKVTRKDGQVYRFTDHDSPLTVGGDVYTPEDAYTRTAIESSAALNTDNMEVAGIWRSQGESAIKEEDLRKGLFDAAQIEVFLVNWADVSMTPIQLRRGWIGEVTMTERGWFKAELRGMAQALQQVVGSAFQPECRADLGDLRCSVPIVPPVVTRDAAVEAGNFYRVDTAGGGTQSAYENRVYEVVTAGTTASSQPAYDTVVGNSTADGTATLTCYQAWTRHGVVDTVNSSKQFTLTVAFDESRAVDGWFNDGLCVFESGANAGKQLEVYDWVQTSRTISLFLSPPYSVSAGDLVYVYPGCDKAHTTCSTRFGMSGSVNFPSTSGNIINFRGEPFIPGIDQASSYPDAQPGA